MLRRLVVVLMGLLVVACTTTDTRSALQTGSGPAAGAKILILQPDVQLAVLTAGGVTEPRADWSRAAQTNLATELSIQLQGKTHKFQMVDPSAAMTGRPGQLLRLHEAVGQSIIAISYGPLKLPTKTGAFDWTLGDGAKSLSETYGADYALFVRGEGTYASSGRVMTAIGLSLLGVSVPLGQQQVFASLVDLRTGRVLWFNVATAGPNADMREPGGAASLARSLLSKIPL